MAQFEAGAVDALLNTTIRELARLKADSRFRATVNQYTGQHYVMFFNTTTPPFDKKEARQAFCYALDRKRFTESILQGVEEYRNLPWPKHSPAYEAAKNDHYALDIEKATTLLSQAGSRRSTPRSTTRPATTSRASSRRSAWPTSRSSGPR